MNAINLLNAENKTKVLTTLKAELLLANDSSQMLEVAQRTLDTAGAVITSAKTKDLLRAKLGDSRNMAFVVDSNANASGKFDVVNDGHAIQKHIYNAMLNDLYKQLEKRTIDESIEAIDNILNPA